MNTLWSELNERQRTELRALFDCDQGKEQERRQLAARGVWDKTPAVEWRWVLYGPVAPPARLWRVLQGAVLIGSTAQRGLWSGVGS